MQKQRFRYWFDKFLAKLLTLLGFSSTFAFVACYAPPPEDLDYLHLSPSALKFLAEGGSHPIFIDTEDHWVLNSSRSFISVSETQGKGSTTLSVMADPNLTEEERYGEILVRGVKGGMSGTIWVTQMSSYFGVSQDSIALPWEQGHSGKVRVVSSNKWSVTDVPSFVSCSPMEGQNGGYVIITTLSQNDSTSRRVGLLHIKDLQDKNATITIIQNMKP